MFLPKKLICQTQIIIKIKINIIAVLCNLRFFYKLVKNLKFYFNVYSMFILIENTLPNEINKLSHLYN